MVHHWEFRGLRDLIETLGPPSGGRVLWFEDLNISLDLVLLEVHDNGSHGNSLLVWTYSHLTQLHKLVPPRPRLGAFKWQARQHLGGA